MSHLVLAALLLAACHDDKLSTPDASPVLADGPLPDGKTVIPDAATADAGCGGLDAGTLPVCSATCAAPFDCSLCATTCNAACASGGCWYCQGGVWRHTVIDCVPRPDAG